MKPYYTFFFPLEMKVHISERRSLERLTRLRQGEAGTKAILAWALLVRSGSAVKLPGVAAIFGYWGQGLLEKV
jgi:hypothetical protein